MNIEDSNFVQKFENFTKLCLKKEKAFNEALQTIERLNEEVRISRQVENNLHFQLLRDRECNLKLQQTLNGFRTVQDEISHQECKILQQTSDISLIENELLNLKTTVTNKVVAASKELELTERIKSLQKLIQDMDDNFHLQSMDRQAIIKEKESVIKQLQESTKVINDELELTKQQISMLKIEMNTMRASFDQKITDYENIINQFNKGSTEGSTTFDSHGHVKSSSNVTKLWDKKVNVTWADAARKSRAEVEYLPPNAACSRSNITPVPHKATTVLTKKDAFDASCSPSFKFKFKTPLPPTRLPTMKVPPFSSKVKPLNVHGNKDNQPKKKQLYSENNSEFL